MSMNQLLEWMSFVAMLPLTTCCRGSYHRQACFDMLDILQAMASMSRSASPSPERREIEYAEKPKHRE